MGRNTIYLKVKKIEDAVSFYSDLGFTIPPIENKSQPLSITGGGDLDLSLVPDSSDSKDFVNYELIQVNFANSHELDKAYEKTSNKGFRTVNKPKNTLWGTRNAKIIDPDGNSILLSTKLK